MLIWICKAKKECLPDKYEYRKYGTGFDSHLEFLFADGSMGRKVITFGADMSSSVP